MTPESNSKYRTDIKHKKTQKGDNLVFQRIGSKCRLIQTRTEQNYKHTRKHKIRFRSNFIP